MPTDVKLIAYYLPQFHPIPENDRWWGKGFTEWANVVKAQPCFRGHYQPHLPADLGFYDLRVGDTRRDQIALAKRYGIDGFCYHYYWFSGKRLLERPLEDMLADQDSDMPFCLCWANENWSRRWDASEHEILIAQDYAPDDDLNFIKSLIPYFSDSRYIRIDGGPLLIVYRPQHLPDARKSAQLWRDYCRSIGFPDVRIFCALTHNNWDYQQFDFDGGVEFPPHNTAQPDLRHTLECIGGYRGYVVDCTEVADMYLARDYRTANCFRTVFPSWDNTPRRGATGFVALNGTPENYEYWLSRAIEQTRSDYPGRERLVFVNAWNEWAEGCHLEPDVKYGHRFLEATARAKRGRSQLSAWAQIGVPIELQPLPAVPVALQPPVVTAQEPPPSKGQALLARAAARLHPAIVAERDALRAQNAKLEAQLDFMISQRDAVAAQRDFTIAQRDAVTTERETALTQRDAVAAQRDAALSERDTVTTERDATSVHRDAVVAHRDALSAHVADLTGKFATLLSDYRALATSSEQVIAHRDQLQALYDGLAGTHGVLISEYDGLAEQRDSLTAQVAALSRMTALSAHGPGDASLARQVDDVRTLYLDLLELVLIGGVYEDPPLPVFGQTAFDPKVRNRGLDWPQRALSMIGAARMRNFRALIERAVAHSVAGDIVETGVWRGGACILARAVLAAYGVTDRRVILADSFAGVPPPDVARFPADEGSNLHDYRELAISEAEVRRNFERFGFLDDQVVLLKGWFRDTIPNIPSSRIAVLRLDGDLYESTIIPLRCLFDRVSLGGWIIVDDYETIPACKSAVRDFLAERGLTPQIRHIDGMGVYFEKGADVTSGAEAACLG